MPPIEIFVDIDKKRFRFPPGTPQKEIPSEQQVAEVVENQLTGYTGPGAGPEGRFWHGVNVRCVRINRLPEQPKQRKNNNHPLLQPVRS